MESATIPSARILPTSHELWHNKDVITNTTLPTFRSRVAPAMREMAYAVLTDRTDSSAEERLGQWPAERGALPHGDADADANINELFAWLSNSIDDAMLLHRRQGRFRLRVYGAKGVETLLSMTLVAEPDMSGELDEADAPDQADELDVPEPMVGGTGSDTDRAMNIMFSTLNQVFRAADRATRNMEKVTSLQLRMQERSQAAHEQFMAQAAEHLRASRQQTADVLDLFVAARLETGEAIDEARAAGGGSGGRREKPPNPLAQEALKQLGAAVQTFMVGGNVPDSVKKLMDHPKAKEILANPRLGEVLDKNPGMADGLFDYLRTVLDAPAADAAPDAAPDDYDIPDPGAA